MTREEEQKLIELVVGKRQREVDYDIKLVKEMEENTKEESREKNENAN